LGREPHCKGRCSHPRRVGNLLEAGRCGDRRLGLADLHSVTGGANIKRELMPSVNIADILCLGCRNHAKNAEEGRGDQCQHGSFLDHVTVSFSRLNRIARAAANRRYAWACSTACSLWGPPPNSSARSRYSSTVFIVPAPTTSMSHYMGPRPEACVHDPLFRLSWQALPGPLSAAKRASSLPSGHDKLWSPMLSSN
jgi:hypothetical protein